MGWPRALAERLARNVIVERRLPARFGGGRWFVSPDAALKYWKFDLDADPELRALGDLATRCVKPGQVVWDVGASMGVFTFAAAAVAGATGSVVAFEPDTLSLTCLRRTVEARSAEMAPVEVIPAAISSAVDLCSFEVAARGRCASHLTDVGGSSQTGGTRARVQVVALTLDWMLERRPPPAVIKIDVETAELQVLLGAKRLFEKARPTLILEVSGDGAREVTELLRGLGYRLHDSDAPGCPEVERAAFNTLALPPVG